MAKNRPSLENIAKLEFQSVDSATANVVEMHKSNISAGSPQKTTRPHTTLYMSRKAQKVIKEIALQFDRKPHDLYLEGIDLMLTRYGRPSLKELAD